MKKLLVFLALLFPLNTYSALSEYANIIVLDKVTANTKTYKMRVGKNYAIDSLDIFVQKCDKTPPEEIPESAVYINIVEPEKSQDVIFKGWMFASNPSINSFEHAVYDVWLKSCE